MKKSFLPIIIFVSMLLGAGSVIFYDRYAADRQIAGAPLEGASLSQTAVQPSGNMTPSQAQKDSGASGSAKQPVFTSLVITPSNPGMLKCSAIQLTAAALDQNGDPFIPTPALAWSSDNPAALPVDSGGVVKSASAGVATITVKSGAVSGATRVTAITSLRPRAGGESKCP